MMTTYYVVAAGVSRLHSIAVALATHTSSCHDAVTSRGQPTGTSPTTWTFCAGGRSFCDAERRSETLRLTGVKWSQMEVGAQHVGATSFSMYNALAAKRLTHVFANAGTKVVVCEKRYVDQIKGNRCAPRFRGIAALLSRTAACSTGVHLPGWGYRRRAARAGATVETEFARNPTAVGAERQILAVRW